MLKIMTVTGADQATFPQDMGDLSREFPFLEWGILVNGRNGLARPRFPDWQWIANLCRRAKESDSLRLSLHLVGPWVESVYAGDWRWVVDLEKVGVIVGQQDLVSPRIFRRIQLNTHGRKHHLINVTPYQINSDLGSLEIELIQQCDGVNDDIFGDFRYSTRITGLFDLSHGSGVSPERWPAPDPRCQWMGYAGGLGPHNLEKQLAEIDKVATCDYWIDMETHVRNEKTLDLDKVRACAEIVRKKMGEA